MRKLAWFLIALLCLVGCANASDLDEAAQKYREHRDYASLSVVAGHLTKGMPRQEVEVLLGPPDYSPVAGTYFYSSDRREFSKEAGRELPTGLVVEFRDRSGKVTERLESWSLGPIGE